MSRTNYTLILLAVIGGAAYLWYISTKPKPLPTPEDIPRDIINLISGGVAAQGETGNILGSIAARLPGGGYLGPIEHAGVTLATSPVLGMPSLVYDFTNWVVSSLKSQYGTGAS